MRQVARRCAREAARAPLQPGLKARGTDVMTQPACKPLDRFLVCTVEAS